MKSRLGGSSRSLAPSPLPWSLPLLPALLSLLALFAAGCSYNSAAPPGGSECDELRPGVTLRYAYTGFDAQGEAVLHGVLTLVLTAEPADDPARLADVSGVWSIEASGEDSGLGPQVGSGRISGVVLKDGSVTLDLNPEMADNNVFLLGTGEPCAALAFAGDWVHSTIAGERTRGSFRAERR